MQNIKEFYLQNQPIDTEIGKCHFIKVSEYPKYFVNLSALAISKNAIVYNYYKETKKNPNKDKKILEVLKQLSLYELIMASEDIRNMYRKLFDFVFKGKNIFFRLITPENFMNLRQLIIEMNVVHEEKINPNPEIQMWNEKSKAHKAALSNDKMTFSDVVSTVKVGCNMTYEEVNKQTLYQLYTDFYRIASFKSYDTMTLFSTVSSEKLNVENWCKHIDLFIEENHTVSAESFNKNKKDLLA